MDDSKICRYTYNIGIGIIGVVAIRRQDVQAKLPSEVKLTRRKVLIGREVEGGLEGQRTQIQIEMRADASVAFPELKPMEGQPRIDHTLSVLQLPNHSGMWD